MAKDRQKQVKNPEKVAGSRVKDEIWAILILALGAFLIIALHTETAGKLGEVVSKLLFGVFGFTAFILPYYLIIYGFLLFLKRAAHIGGRSVIFYILIYLMIVLIYSGRFIEPGYVLSGPVQIYSEGVARTGGGVFGMYAGVLLVKFIGKAGLYIFTSVVILVSLLLVINTPISQFIDKIKIKRAVRRAEKELPEEEAEEEVKNEEAKPKRGHFFARAKKPEPGPETISEPVKAPVAEPPAGIMTESQSKIIGYMKDDSLFEKAEIYEYREDAETAHFDRNAKVQIADEINYGSMTKAKYSLPSIEFLHKGPEPDRLSTNVNLNAKAAKLEETLRNFNVDAQVLQVTQGPAVTRYEIQPNVGVKVNSIVRLADDIALNLEARSIRLEAPIPGKAAVGIEVENDKVQMVTLRDILATREFKDSRSKITFAVGKDIAGNSIIANLKDMPHMLIAGPTGSGKSVCINSIIISILYKAAPHEVKLVLIDPKVVELGNYNGIPHLLIPVVTEPSKAAAALNWAVSEMTDRYIKFAEEGAKDLESYNTSLRKKGDKALILPQIVIIIEELADLMMTAPSQVEESICRLAQKARAAGMHLIVATQRPSVDVITGVIKANVPSRIAFAVSSQFDSRTILDMAGAEKLVGKGDMLFKPTGIPKPIRVQGTFISDSEVHKVIEYIKSQSGGPDYAGDVIHVIEKGNFQGGDNGDDLLPDAIETVVKSKQASASWLQRRFRIGYNRAARLIEMMEARGIIGPPDGSRPRQVLMSEEEFGDLDDETRDFK